MELQGKTVDKNEQPGPQALTIGVTPSAILTNTDFVYSIQDAERRDQDTKQLATLSLN